ncbi:GNAT family N-acetyltransferase [Orbaceae bacterium ESL0721]|nr:GNAT family N-acetyltransferase [Orbaceae bacterium ESL0721]
MIIKAINHSDAKPYLALLHRAYKQTSALGIHFAAATANLALIHRHISANAIYAIQKEGKLISTLMIRYPWGDNPGPYGLPHLGWFATDPDYARQGLGGELLMWVEAHILQNILKAPAVTLGTAKNHPWLIKMYERHGFRQIGEADLGLGHKTIYLKKILTESDNFNISH